MIQELLSKVFISSAQAATPAEPVCATFPPITKLNDVHVPTGGADKLGINLDTIKCEIIWLQRGILYIGGAVALLYFLYGAVSYIISYGNEAKAAKAKQTMIWAVMGVVVIALAQLMVNLVEFYTKK